MTTTDTTATVTAVTADAASLLRALTNAALFAGTDDTLPALTCLHLTAADGTLTVEATDRYAIGREAVPAAGVIDVLAGAKDTLTAVKPLAAACKARNLAGLAAQPVITVTVDGDYVRFTLTGHLAPDLSVTVTAGTGEFPRTARLWPDAADDYAAYTAECTGHVRFNSAYLLRLAKVADADSPRNTLPRFTFGEPAKPVVVHVGERFRALVMPVRDPA